MLSGEPLFDARFAKVVIKICSSYRKMDVPLFADFADRSIEHQLEIVHIQDDGLHSGARGGFRIAGTATCVKF